MASLVIGAAIASTGAQLSVAGSLVAAGLGAVFDNALLFPTLFPPEDTEGPRINELHLQGAEEGKGVPWISGRMNRVGGQTIWISDLIEQVDTEEVGKGGGGQRHKTYTYYVDIAVAYGGPSVRVDKIQAEGELVWSSATDVSISSDQITASVVGSNNLQLSTPADGPDLSAIRAGRNVTISGFTNAINNGSFRCASSSKQPDGSTRATVIVVGGQSEFPGAVVSISQDNPEISDGFASKLTFYDGSESQMPDPLIESYEGVGNVPAYRGTSYVVIERMSLPNRRIPQLQIFVEAPEQTVSSVVYGLMQRSGFEPSEFNAAGLSEPNKGYSVVGPTSTAKLLQPLMLTHNLLEQERGDTLHFFRRQDAAEVRVEERHLAATDDERSIPKKIDTRDVDDVRLPSDVAVRYLEEVNDLQHGAQGGKKSDAPLDDRSTIDLPIVLDGAEAKSIAKRAVWVAWASRQKFIFSLPPSYVHIAENDVVRVRNGNEIHNLLVSRVDIGANFLVKVEATAEVKAVLDQPATADPPKISEPELYLAPPVTVEPMDIPPVTPDAIQSSDPGIYVAAAYSDPKVLFRGAQVYQSIDDLDFTEFCSVDQEAVMGQALDALPAGPVGYWDRESTVEVLLDHGTLENRSERDVLEGSNHAVIAGEIIGFQNATLIGARLYRLDTLLRGRRNTEDKIAGHAAGDAFVLISSAVSFKSLTIANIGQTRYLKAVAGGGFLDEAESRQQTFTGRSLQPFSPAHVRGAFNSSIDIELDWVRRSRALARVFGAQPIPMLEITEAYEIDVIYPSGSGNVVATKTVAAATSYVYTVLEQGEDGISVGASVDFVIYQMSPIVGRGRPSETLTVELT